jgi:hypothetical protein
VRSAKKIEDKMQFGDHKRAVLYKGDANFLEIIQAEASGDNIERLPGTQEEQGESLVIGQSCSNSSFVSLIDWPIVTASDKVRDRVQQIVRGHLHQKMTMSVLEYQP